ncbi:MAG: tungstate ABC transporter substrate-binding protein WtpA [Methanobacterium sp.]|jgi:molybdate/tungstate transport system substrate-binding protein|uniref:tungstate ABC transporter substrate-binding protein WtpA n=1 Tax=Methanobacterium sp. TaxID=2164 RepID=UPI0025901A16|nr:tungstate ABC transporter substrate-binding protein WtpA [Methanobacterium sp.]MCC7560590.1 tungstate ABC transporter substrate-binding protein WtpA [Methanobacterium sp.]
MNNKTMVAIVIIIIAVGGVGVYGYNTYVASSESGTITIYAAASLAKQMNATAAEFKTKHPNVDVQIQYGGSSDLISQITQLNKSVDIMASADYGLIDKNMIPDYTSFNIKYARNEMVIAYTDKSKNSSQINSTNWYQILNQSDVKIGIADPNSAPAGYRGVMMIQLANSFYNNSNIFNDLIASNTAITSQANGTGYIISSPNNLNPASKIVSRPAVSDLMPVLQSDSVDYVLVYKSDAEQQKSSGVKYLTLPGELALSNTTYESTYKKYKLIQFSDTNKSKSVTLTPIVYGITVLNNAPQRNLAIEFVQLLLSPEGNRITQNSFQDPIVPAVATNGSTNIPESLQQYIKQ